MKKSNIVIIGGGISGIISSLSSIDKNDVPIVDSSSNPDGLLRSEFVNGVEFDYDTHFIMESLDKKTGCNWFEVGEQLYKNHPIKVPTKKELGISEFKAGFGGKTQNVLRFNFDR